MITESEQKKKQQAEAAALQQKKAQQQKQQTVSVANLEQELEIAKQASTNKSSPIAKPLVESPSPLQSTTGQTDNSADVEAYQQQLANKSKAIQWYQLGKDNLCYLMSVDNGVTDIVKSVDASQCK